VAWTCALAPDAVTDPAKPVALMEAALTTAPRNPHYLNTLGAALYRSGRFEDAVRRLEESVRVQGQGGAVGDWLFLALAHQRLGHADEARRWLDRAVKWLDQATQQQETGTGGPALAWNECLQWTLLRGEAEAQVRGIKP
jgi:uncharacterized protein HemY